jgi:hypothetical protein
MAGDERLSDAAFRVAVAEVLHFHNTKTGQCNPSTARIAEASTKHRATVIEANKKLAALGYMDIAQSNGGRNRRNKYSFDFTKTVGTDDSLETEAETKTVGTGDTNCRPGRHETVVPDDTRITLELNSGINTGSTNGAVAPFPVPTIIEPEKKEEGYQVVQAALPCLAVSPDKVAEEVFEAFVLMAERLELPVPKCCNEERLNKIKRLIKEHGVEGWQAALDAFNNCGFLQGINDRGWTLTLDWLLKPANFTKVIEGNYARNTSRTQPSLVEFGLDVVDHVEELTALGTGLDDPHEFERRLEEKRQALRVPKSSDIVFSGSGNRVREAS